MFKNIIIAIRYTLSPVAKLSIATGHAMLSFATGYHRALIRNGDWSWFVELPKLLFGLVSLFGFLKFFCHNFLF